MRIVAVNAGLSEPSSTRLLVDRIVESVATELESVGSTAEFSVIDLRSLAVDIGASLAAGFSVDGVDEAIAQVHSADALIVATPVFNASYSGLFKSFFDLVDVDAMTGTPVLIAATGGSPRHSMVLDYALRPMFTYLRTIVVPTGIYAATEDWASEGDVSALSDRIRRAASELAALVGPTPPSVPSAASAGAPEVEDVASRAEAAGITNFARLLGDSHAG